MLTTLSVELEHSVNVSNYNQPKQSNRFAFTPKLLIIYNIVLINLARWKLCFSSFNDGIRKNYLFYFRYPLPCPNLSYPNVIAHFK